MPLSFLSTLSAGAFLLTPYLKAFERYLPRIGIDTAQNGYL